MRLVKIAPGFLKTTPESALISFGDTRVLCTATVEERVPPFLKGKGQGWVTAEYNMLPRSGQERVPREQFKGGRAQEISRLIGRSLRAACDLTLLGEKTITIDCDVLQADGGTRTAAITGAWTALYLAVKKLLREGKLECQPLSSQVAAVSVGLVNGSILLDLCYAEDSRAQADINVVVLRPIGRQAKRTGESLAEVQATAEKGAFTVSQLGRMIQLAEQGSNELFSLQQRVLKLGPER
jgi:ribonuclease PH